MNLLNNLIRTLPRFVAIEALKLKRTSVLLMTFALPALVIIFLVGMSLKASDLSQFDEQSWLRWWSGVIALWCHFMLPLTVALVTSSINATEHKNEGWRLMLAMPVNLYSLYIAKVIIAVFLITLTSVMLWVFGLLGSAMLSGMALTADTSWGSPLLTALPAMILTCLPVILIQHGISWRVPTMIVPLSVGVVATMGIVQIGSSEYWVYYPWSYMLMSSLANDVALRGQAIELSLIITPIVLFISLLMAAKHKRAG